MNKDLNALLIFLCSFSNGCTILLKRIIPGYIGYFNAEFRLEILEVYKEKADYPDVV